METSVVCPVSEERVNETVVRIVGGFIFLLSIAVLFNHNLWIAAFLIIDFATRAFTKGNYSLLKFIAKKIVQTFSLSNKPIDAAPKKFAALVGFIFSVVISFSLIFGWIYIANITTVVLIVCSGLESFAGYCVGCQFYSWIVLPVKKLFNK